MDFLIKSLKSFAKEYIKSFVQNKRQWIIWRLQKYQQIKEQRHFNEKEKENYEQATDDTFLNEYRTVDNENQDRPHAPQNRTADFEEAIETNARHGPDEITTITFA